MAISNDPRLGRPAPRGMELPTSAIVGPLVLLCVTELVVAYGFWAVGGERLKAGLLVGVALGTLATIRYWSLNVGAIILNVSMFIIGAINFPIRDFVSWAHESWWPLAMGLVVIASR
jgi:hypothetical protein